MPFNFICQLMLFYFNLLLDTLQFCTCCFSLSLYSVKTSAENSCHKNSIKFDILSLFFVLYSLFHGLFQAALWVEKGRSQKRLGKMSTNISFCGKKSTESQ